MTKLELDATRIERTIQKLHKRIDERFPGRGLSKLCAQLLEIAQEDNRRRRWHKKPNIWIRLTVAAVLGLGVFIAVQALLSLMHLKVEAEAMNALQGAEAIVNIVALLGAAIWFLLNLKSVWRREAVLRDLHELRSIAHVVDMHQLTKDPTRYSAANPDAQSHSGRAMTPFELERYLDYCAEMLALTGKLAALYMQDVRDPIIIQAVNEIEELTTSLSRKIWQKIMVLRPSNPLAP